MSETTEKHIGKYKVKGRISEGSTSVVYVVEADGNEFALKLLKTNDPDTIARFRQESSTLARIKHANIVSIYDIGEHNGAPFLVMERIEGQPLQELLIHQTKLPAQKAINIVIEVAQALQEFHRQELVHRDIKPANIIIRKSGIPVLIDFGFVAHVKQIETESAVTGTPLYCPPEQAKILKRPVDARSDLYSLAVTLFEMVAGRAPFLGSVAEIIQQHATAPIPDLEIFCESAPKALGRILKKSLMKDPDDRYQSASGLIVDLQTLSELEKKLESGEELKLGQHDRKNRGQKVKFISRDREMKQLTTIWQNVEIGTPTFAIVSGSSGTGKSRICEEFVSSIGSKPLVLSSKCQFQDKELPFGPFRDAINGFYDEIIGLNDSERGERIKLLRSAAEGAEDHVLMLTRTLGKLLAVTTSKVARSSDIEDDRELFLSNLAEFFGRLAGKSGSLIFLVDDIQWLDETSLQLFLKILERSKERKILVLATARDEKEYRDRVNEVEECLQVFTSPRITATPFTIQQLSALIKQFLGTDDIATSICEVIFNKSKGNVFLAMEYLRSGLEQGFLEFKNEAWHLQVETLEKIAMSENVYGQIVRRIESSSHEAQLFYSYAALLGNTFRQQLIAEITKMSPSTIQEVFRIGIDLGIVEKVGAAKLKFSHDKIPEALIANLTDEQKRKMSLEIALCLSARDEQTEEEIFASARLFALVQSSEHALSSIKCFNSAGSLAFSNYAFKQGYNYLKMSLEIIDTDSSHRGIEETITEKLAICATFVGDERVALDCINRVVYRSSEPVNRANAKALKVWVLSNLSLVAQSWEEFRSTCELLGSSYPTFIHWKFLIFIFNVTSILSLEILGLQKLFRATNLEKQMDGNRLTGMYKEAINCCEMRGNSLDTALVSSRMLKIAYAIGGSREKAIGLTAFGYFFGHVGLKDLAALFFQRAKVYFSRASDPTLTAHCEFRELLGSFYCGLIKDFNEEFKSEQDFFSKYLSPAEFGRLSNLNAILLSFRGRHKEAIELFRNTLTADQVRGAHLPRHSRAIALNHLSVALAATGEHNQAQKVKEAALKETYLVRYCPGAGFGTLAGQIHLARITQDINQDVEQVALTFVKRRLTLFGDPLSNNFMAQVAFVRLYQLERTQTSEEKFGARREFLKRLLRLPTTSFAPLFKANYLYLKGAFHRLQNQNRLAQYYYSVAEKNASESGSFALLFEIERDRARIFRATKQLELMKLHLKTAVDICLDQGWSSVTEQLNKEFEDFIPTLHLGQGNANASQSNSAGRSNWARANSTVAASARNTVVSRTVHVRGTKAASKLAGVLDDANDIESMRYTSALMKVSEAFVKSPNPRIQAKEILSQIVKFFAAERGFLFVKEEEFLPTSLIAAIDSSGEDLENTKNYSSTLVKRATDELQSIVIESQEDAELLGSESAILNNLRSLAAIPLKLDDKYLGMVYLDSSLTRGLFGKGDLELMNMLCKHISIVYQLDRIAKVELEKANIQKQLDIQKAIAEEARKVEILVDNMQQALFSVSADGLIIDPISQFSKRVFGKTIVGEKAIDVLYQGDELNREIYDSVSSVFNTVFGEDELQWSLMESNLPRKQIRRTSSENAAEKNEKVLKISPAPIWNKDSLLERLLFVVEDVTEFEALEKKVRLQQEQTEITSCIFENSLDKLKIYITKFSETLTKCQTLAAGTLTKDSAREVLRDLHTIKGNARLYKMGPLSSCIHEVESAVGVVNWETPSSGDIELLKSKLQLVKDLIAKYMGLIDQLLTVNRVGASNQALNPRALSILNELLINFDQTQPKALKSKLQFALQRLNLKSIGSMISNFGPMISELSKDLNKSIHFEVLGDADANEHQIDRLQECLLHLLRNSADHGIESPDERARMGKTPTANVSVQLEDSETGLVIRVRDDGRGIDSAVIAQKALEKGLTTTEELAQMTDKMKIDFIFAPGFSTKDSATDISGRGIGMDVVKKKIAELGGRLEVNSRKGEGSEFAIFLQAENAIKAA